MITKEALTFITFFLAITGYCGLTIAILFSLQEKIPIQFWRIVSAIILLHVIMVWSFHYEGNFFTAVRNGYSGFIIFHSALLMIIVSNFVKRKLAILLVRISFIIVSIGAVGAVFRYDVVAVYKLPVIFFVLLVVVSVIRKYYLKSKLIKTKTGST